MNVTASVSSSPSRSPPAVTVTAWALFHDVVENVNDVGVVTSSSPDAATVTTTCAAGCNANSTVKDPPAGSSSPISSDATENTNPAESS